MPQTDGLATDSSESPWRWLMPALFAALAGAALWLDMPLARYFHDEPWPWKGDVKRLVSLAEAFSWGGAVAFILLAAALLDHRGWRIVPRLALGCYGAGLSADIIKMFVARKRPAEMDLAKTGWETFLTWLPAKHLHETQSFPSAHTATAVGLAFGLSFLYPRGKCLFITLAVLAGIQRMQSQSHYLSDVLAGAAIGSLFGLVATSRSLVGKWLERLERL